MNRAIAYAEDTLGIHRTWVETMSLAAQLNDLYGQLAGFTTETRILDWSLDERKNELLVLQSKANTEMSIAAFERHMKLVFAEDDQLASIGKTKVDAMARRDAVEASIKSVERNSNGCIARMKQLGGYLEYLAVTKAAQMQAASVVQAANESPW